MSSTGPHKDLINAIDFFIEHQEVTGSVNITSPYQLTQQKFTQQLEKALNRPLFLKIPKMFIKKILGEMGDYLLLKGQRVLPRRLNEFGFKFAYLKIKSVLGVLWKNLQKWSFGFNNLS